MCGRDTSHRHTSRRCTRPLGTVEKFRIHYNRIEFGSLTFHDHQPVRPAANDVSVGGQRPVVGHARRYAAIPGLPQGVRARGGAGRRLRYHGAGPGLVADRLLLTVPVTMRPRAPLGQRAPRAAGHVTVLPGQRFLLAQRAAERRFHRFAVVGPHARDVSGRYAVSARSALIVEIR